MLKNAEQDHKRVCFFAFQFASGSFTRIKMKYTEYNTQNTYQEKGINTVPKQLDVKESTKRLVCDIYIS